MNKTRIFFSITLICLLSLTNIFAQTETPRSQPQAEPSYEVVLQVLTASNNASVKSPIPQSLSNVVKKLKNDFSFANYSLDTTYFQRTAGSIDLTSVSNESNQNDEGLIIFSNWSLIGLKSIPNVEGRNSIQFERLNFGQRVPIKSSTGAINYQQVGISLQKFSIPINMPTVVGSLSTSKSDGLVFLVLTVKPTE